LIGEDERMRMLSPLESNFLIPNATFLVLVVLVLLVIVVPIVAVTWMAVSRRRAQSEGEQTSGRALR
jgi:uncharacterized membrane protein